MLRDVDIFSTAIGRETMRGLTGVMQTCHQMSLCTVTTTAREQRTMSQIQRLTKTKTRSKNDDDEVIKETGDASTEPVTAEEELPQNDRDVSTRENSKSRYRSKLSSCVTEKKVFRIGSKHLL